VEVIEMGVLEFLLIWAAITFAVSAWVYAYTVPHIPQSVEKVLGLVWVSSLLLLAAVSTVIALAHI
jgi:cytosine/uracil/thiamine/allantoin permease